MIATPGPHEQYRIKKIIFQHILGMHFKTYINNRERIFIAITSKNRYFVRTLSYSRSRMKQWLRPKKGLIPLRPNSDYGYS